MGSQERSHWDTRGRFPWDPKGVPMGSDQERNRKTASIDEPLLVLSGKAYHIQVLASCKREGLTNRGSRNQKVGKSIQPNQKLRKQHLVCTEIKKKHKTEKNDARISNFEIQIDWSFGSPGAFPLGLSKGLSKGPRAPRPSFRRFVAKF